LSYWKRSPNVAAVRGEGGLTEILLIVGALGQLQAVAPAAVVEPNLSGTQRPARSEVLARGDELAIGAPRRIVEQAEILRADFPGIRTVPFHNPDVVAATPVAREGDPLAVRAEARLHVPRETVGQRARRAALDRHDEDVSQQVEDDLLAVGADVQVHPGAFGGVDLHLVGITRRVLDLPLLLFLFGRLLIGGLFLLGPDRKIRASGE
jgi:hypothetical protein